MLLAIGIIQALAGIFLILVILLQTGKTPGLSGAIAGGGGDTFLSKNKGRTLDARMARATKWIAVVFIILTLVISLIV